MMDIGEAIKAMRSGERVARPGWNGKGMWLTLVPGAQEYRDYVQMKDATNMLVPWLASQTDLLAQDWEVVS
jgi:hypothetical protein